MGGSAGLWGGSGAVLVGSGGFPGAPQGPWGTQGSPGPKFKKYKDLFPNSGTLKGSSRLFKASQGVPPSVAGSARLDHAAPFLVQKPILV